MSIIDSDEPLLSGSGVVSKEVTDENLLEAWSDLMVKWHQNLSQRPKQVHQLCKKGVPEALRGEVWQLLAGCHHSSELLEAYRVLITKVGGGNPVGTPIWYKIVSYCKVPNIRGGVMFAIFAISW